MGCVASKADLRGDDIDVDVLQVVDNIGEQPGAVQRSNHDFSEGSVWVLLHRDVGLNLAPTPSSTAFST